MPDLLIRKLPEETIASLKRAVRHRRSLEAEARLILETASAEPDRDEAIARIDAIYERLEATGRDFGDSTLDIRTDRDR